MIANFGVDVGFSQPSKIKFMCNACFFSESSQDIMSSSSNKKFDLTTIRIASLCFQCCPSFLNSCESLNQNSNSMKKDNYNDDKIRLTELQYSLLAVAERLVIVLSDKYNQFDTINKTKNWFSTCEEAIYALFHVHPNPEEILGKLVLSLFSSWQEGIHKNISTLTICRLSRFLFLLGQGLLGLLLYTEKIANLSKKAQEKDNLKKIEAKDQVKKSTKSKQTKQSSSSSSSSGGKGKEIGKEKSSEVNVGVGGNYEDDEEIDAMEEEMGMTAAADADHEKVSHYYFLFYFNIYFIFFIFNHINI